MDAQGRAVLIRPEDNPDVSEGGILIPKTAEEKPNIGTVLAVGPGCTTVRIGDRVQYKRKGASVMQKDGEDLHWVIEEQIFYIYGR